MTEFALTGGLCITPFWIDIDGYAVCGDYEDEYFIPEGCIDTTLTDQVSCEDADGIWRIPSNNQTDCLSRGYSCWDEDQGAYTLKDQTECEACSGVWQPLYPWVTGTWTTGEVLPTAWIPREFKPLNTRTTGFLYTRFIDAVENAASKLLSLSFVTDAWCRYDSSIRLLDSFTCDCVDESTDTLNCYSSNPVTTRQGIFHACNNVPDTIDTNPVRIEVQNDTVSVDAICITIQVSVVSSSQFELNPEVELSSLVFTDRITSPTAVVKNDNEAVVGEFITEGINITLSQDPTQPLRICIRLLPNVTQSDDFPIPDFGIVRGGDDDNFEIEALGFTDVVLEGEDLICGTVSSSGVYFGIKRLQDFEDERAYSQSIFIQSIIGAILNFLVILFCVLQIVVIVSHASIAESQIQKKLSFILIVLIFCLSKNRHLHSSHLSFFFFSEGNLSLLTSRFLCWQAGSSVCCV